MPSDGSQRNSRTGQVVAITGAAACVLYLLVMFYRQPVCQEELALDSTVHRVCRPAALTDAFMAPAVALLIVALSTFFAEISGFGITIKRRLDKVEKVAAVARDEARDALLAARYNAVRAQFRAGDERNKAMHAIWDEMLLSVRDVQPFDVDAHIGDHGNPGVRLAGYAYLMSHPDPRWVDPLLKAIAADRMRFNQEMGLRVLGVILKPACGLLTTQLRTTLQRMQAKFRAQPRKVGGQSARAAEIDRILAACPP